MEKRYNYSEFEKKIQEFWQKNKTYIAQNNPGPLYSIDTPPPTISGTLHIGHLFSYTQTDIIARYKRMEGNSVFYPFGFDDNGLPTERYVEKRLKISAHKLGRAEFIKKCLEVTKDIEEDFKEIWKQIGLSVDWSICYSTISDEVRKLSQESFIQLYKKGHVYRKLEPSLYCPTCRTSVAQAELEDVEKDSFFNDIVFKTEDGKELLIGTTRPELLPSCVAVLYNPKDERYTHLKKNNAVVPLFGHIVPILQDENVSIEKGTGLVMVCTFGDKSDMEWVKKFKLPYKQSIGFDGKLMTHTGIFSGLKINEAREKIIEQLEKEGLIVNKKPIKHFVNTHERCKKEIEILSLPQWFLKILDFKKNFLELADKINWYPAFMKSRYIDWVENIGWDWCLSRQRFYGIAFPAWYCLDCNQILLAETKDLPIDPQETAYPGQQCTKCKSNNIVPDTDVMDTWNTSSLTPYILYNHFKQEEKTAFEKKKIPEFIPMGMRPQAHDIIRTWAFYTIVKTWMHHGIIPWKDIVISGHVLSDSKEKLSKSKGGGPLDPQWLIEHYSADAVRYWTASGGLGKDISFSENQIKIGQKLITKLWNAFRFIKTHIDVQTDKEKIPTGLGALNEYILHEATRCFTQFQNYFTEQEFGLALQQIDTFFWATFCDNYLELIKDQLFNPDNYTKESVDATKWTLYCIGLKILQLYAPYVPHVSEAIYQTIYKENEQIDSLHLTKFKNIQKKYNFEDSCKKMKIILNLVAQMRKLKTNNKLSLKTDIDTLEVYSSNLNLLNVIEEHEKLIRGVTHTHIVELKNETIGESRLEKIGDRLKTAISIE